MRIINYFEIDETDTFHHVIKNQIQHFLQHFKLEKISEDSNTLGDIVVVECPMFELDIEYLRDIYGETLWSKLNKQYDKLQVLKFEESSVLVSSYELNLKNLSTSSPNLYCDFEEYLQDISRSKVELSNTTTKAGASRYTFSPKYR